MVASMDSMLVRQEKSSRPQMLPRGHPAAHTPAKQTTALPPAQ